MILIKTNTQNKKLSVLNGDKNQIVQKRICFYSVRNRFTVYCYEYFFIQKKKNTGVTIKRVFKFFFSVFETLDVLVFFFQ